MATPLPSKTTTYRLQGIPQDIDVKGVEKIVRDVLVLQTPDRVEIKSLASNPYRSEEKVATLNLPDGCFSPSNDVEWKRMYSNTDMGLSTRFDLIFDTHFHGFTPLHSDDDKNCQIDLIAVSGLGGHAFGSFKERDGEHMWLRDSLAHDLPGVRIFIFGYDSMLTKSTSSQTILDLGKHLQSSIHIIHRNQPQDPAQPRPILFIGHSLGGLLIKQVGLFSSPSQVQGAECMTNLNSVRGLVFFGVPSQGMNIGSLIPMVSNDQPNRFLLESLGKASTVLRDQTREFREVFQHRNASIISFYETRQSPTAIEVTKDTWKMNGPPALLVDVYSSTQHRAWEEPHLPLDRTHSDMVKYRSKYDEHYSQVLFQLSLLSRDACTIIRTRLSYKHEHISDIAEADPMRNQQKLAGDRNTSDCLQSLAFKEQDNRRSGIQTVQDGCNWILDHSAYTSWVKNYPGLLWIRGKPGAGKSTLLKFIVSRHEAQATADESIISFFFTARGSEMEKTPFGMIRSLLHQLLSYFPGQLLKLARKFERRCKASGLYGDKWKWSMGELQDFFYESVLAIEQQSLCIYVDALDEAGEVDARMITNYLGQLVGSARAANIRLRICFSCRHYPIIAWADGQIICVEDENTQAIKSYARKELQRNFKKEQLQALLDVVITKADGVFLWVTLVVSRLIILHGRGKSFKQIQQSLNEIPSDLSTLYEEILPRADDEELMDSIKLFQWICFAQRPMRISELQHAICFDVEKRYRNASEFTLGDDFVENEHAMKQRIIDLSRGLAEVKHENFNLTIQLIHLSVKDYLINTGFKRLLGYFSESSPSPIGIGHVQILRTSVLYLGLEDRYKWCKLDESTRYSLYPLLEYASLHWVSHARLAEHEGIHLSLLLSDFRWPNVRIFDSWFAMYVSDHRYLNEFYSVETRPTIVHLAAYEGLDSVVKSLPQSHSYQLNQRDGGGSTPLHWALRSGHSAVSMNLLSKAGLIINRANNKGRTPLHLAIKAGNVEIVEILLQRDEVRRLLNQPDDMGAPLYLAFYKGDSPMLKLLLQQNETSVDLCDAFERCALHYLAGIYSRPIIHLVLEKSTATLNRRDFEGRTPLSAAIQYDNIKVVDILLQQDGLDINMADEDGRSPLYYAVATDLAHMVKLLLQRPDLKVNATDVFCNTSLDLAISKGYTYIEQLLREAGGQQFETLPLLPEAV